MRVRKRMRLRKSVLIFCVAASAMLALAALPTVEKSIAAGPPAAEVKIDNFSFTPATLTVKAGTQITWTNADDIRTPWSAKTELQVQSARHRREVHVHG